MASPPSSSIDDDIFEKLKRADPKDLEALKQATSDRRHATFLKGQTRLAELIDQNSTSPTTISSITVLGAPNTRRSFLAGILNPLLSANRDRPYTQSEVVREVAASARKLDKFGELFVR
jgi:outer membrane protein insertion porin family